MNTPIVSVCMICYNQEKYISQAIEGVLMQKTNFPIQLVIGEDCSTDGTWAICRDYADKNPDRIKLLPSVKNLGPMNNFIRTLDACDGKYIAICEGDDYWTDPAKLHKQVGFLEINSDYVFCFHDVAIYNENTGKSEARVGTRSIDDVVDIKSVISQNNIATASIIFRNIFDFKNMPEWFYKNGQKGDYGLVVILAEKGLGKFMTEQMSVYRVHGGGIWSGQNIDKRYQADDLFYGFLHEYFKSPDIRAVISEKKRYVHFSWGVNLIRRRQYIKGFFKSLANYSPASKGVTSTQMVRVLIAFKDSFSRV